MGTIAVAASLTGNLKDTAQGKSAPHANLREGLITVAIATLPVHILATVLLCAIAKGHLQSDIHTL
ncbi:hypothetical protein [Paracoccus tegillarcae]|uniref:hypothetical protein n=1 Tax=Paracoccus tegillarcae TaxID=1529068 RepID=UPI001300A7CD|nr:hypothetical protein [Paracoccus tegillarcae]